MTPDVLSQSEIDSLLDVLTSGEVDFEEISQASAEKNVKGYDFRRPDKFSKDQLRAIQMIHESFSRQLTTSLSTMVRSIVTCEVASVDQVAYEEFVRSMVQPTVMGVLEMYPLEGNAVVEMNPNLVFAIIDRLLGGKGEVFGKPRDLTDIESTVIERVFMRMLELLEDSWSTVIDVRFRFDSMESNPFFVQICPGTDMVLLVTLRVSIGDVEGMVSLCIPYFVMEPVMDKLSSQIWFASTGKNKDQDHRGFLTASLGTVKVPVHLELGDTVLSLFDVMRLRVGDVIRLDSMLDDPVRVRVGSRIKFTGRPGTVDGRYSVEVLEVADDGSSEEEEE
ncbi:flagellar motor switch protein FliM [Dethiosulfovibrio peptidovorans DSM 11002]|uniref:Flagellar motor switch protein FliM n=1 Tax=Dethiosulfovibrio peptidovorans DSM 11002 TaxID=469381 RepID=D2Z3K8_9BACT|nr:flagellar motor switch protein FliM [Dethiosulfovibrio peptidovorans]EFC90314.1 flagellar motor switch protein FliM [Dethiosulfovibrio peptidovorans DSM 11002]